MGSHTIAYTVSSFIKLLTTLKTPSPSVVRWMADLSLYNYEVRHISGSNNTAADALSRMYPEESLALLEIDVSPDWTEAYKADPPHLEFCYQPDGQLKADWRQSWHGGRLRIGDRLLVPASKYDTVITQFHQPLVAGHWGIPRVTGLLQRHFVVHRVRRYGGGESCTEC